MEFKLLSLISVFAAAMAGSFHCVGMCGGISLSVTEGKFKALWAYHLSRLVGYLLIGAIAGSLGEVFFFNASMRTLGVILGWTMALSLLISGLLLWLNRPVTYPHALLSALSQKIMRKGFQLTPLKKAAVVGFASVFLPCGWLYTFVLLSIGTRTPWGGLLTLLVFWMGTLPALMGGSLILRDLLKKSELSAKKLTAVLMMLSGVISIHLHFKHSSVTVQNPETPQVLICH